MRLLALVVIICPIGWSNSPSCERAFPGSIPLEKNHRTYRLLGDLERKAKIPQSILLCVWKTFGDRSLDIRSLRANAQTAPAGTIVATRTLLEIFSNAALDGALAHELGHIIIGRWLVPQSKSGKEYEERRVDAYAIRLAGSASLRSTYLEYTGNAALAKRRVARAEALMFTQKSP
ncbi:MAG: M48 family metalloprotease [Patescibacteria group bacterium]|nr:M48 family metalloprotease [Patescibacteria group bacterium]